MASKVVLLARSALPMKQKRNVLVNECVRRLRNCKPEQPWDTQKKFIQDYVLRMYHAKYDEQFRQNVVKQAIDRYDGMFAADAKGHQPLYRDRHWNKTGRLRQKANRKTNWLSKDGYDTVIMVNSTHGGELARAYQQVVDANPGPVKIKIQEKGGISVKSIVHNTNPNKTKGCDAGDCLPCKNGGGGECHKNSVGYELTCDVCGADVCYVGETGQNAYTRGMKHIENYKNKREDSPIWMKGTPKSVFQ